MTCRVLLERGAVGVVLSRSSTTAHAVIVARGLGLPMVLRAGDEIGRLPRGTTLVLDGDAGTVRVAPDPQQIAEVRQRSPTLAGQASSRTDAAKAPVFLKDGRQILVVANIGSVADARAAVESGADGVGLLRTELLVLDREDYPDEDTQTSDLAAIFEVLEDRPVVVRVLDAGGDKPVTALDLDPVHNGFLGVRGLRYLLAHPDVLRTQLRAIFRAARRPPGVGDGADGVRRGGGGGVPGGGRRRGRLAWSPTATPHAAARAGRGDDRGAGRGAGRRRDLRRLRLRLGRLQRPDQLHDGRRPHRDRRRRPARPSATAVQRLLDQLCAFAVESGTPVAVCGEIAGMPEQAWRWSPGECTSCRLPRPGSR